MDVSAILTTSANANAVAEAFAMSDVLAAVASITVPASVGPDQLAFEARLDDAAFRTRLDRAASLDRAVTGETPVDPTALGAQPRAMQVPSLLTTLSDLPRSDVRDYLSQHPDAVADLLAAPTSTSAVAAWWSRESLGTRANLSALAPQLIGNLEGLPYDVRAAANDRYLDSTIRSLKSQLGSVGRAASDDLKTRVHMLEQISTAVHGGTSAEPRSLVTLDVTGTGRAVIVVGDLATADYVTYMVPGMFYSVDNELVSWTDAAAQLAVDQQAWLDRLAPNQSDSVATVAWIGYQTPSLVDVTSLDGAKAGSVELAESLHGLAAIRGAHQPYLSILTHSYGSTVALLALENSQLGLDAISVDSLAMVGSPGSDAKTVGDLNVRGGNVWVADAALDPVSHAGVFGSQPMSPSYGAKLFGVTGATDQLTGAKLTGSMGHVDYFTSGSESFRNMALISIGRGGYALNPDGVAGAQARALAR